MRQVALKEIHAFISRAGITAPGDQTGTIFVDLFHSNDVYLLRSLLVAAYLRILTGRRLVGLMGKPGVVIRSCGDYDVTQHLELAQAFQLDETWQFTSPSDSAEVASRAFFDTLNDTLIRQHPPRDFRRTLLNASDHRHSMPLGRLIYETTIRAELCGTVSQIDESLMHWGADVEGLAEWFSARLNTCPRPFGTRPLFVTGHIDYSPWAVLADLIRLAEGEVFYFTTETAFTVYRLVSPWQPDMQLSGIVADIEKNWFRDVVWPRRAEFLPAARHHHVTEWRYRPFQTWTARNRPDSPPGIATLAARACKDALCWDPARAVNIVFCQAMADQPIPGTKVFTDRSDWATDTIEFAASHPERNWVIKAHPRDAEYDHSATLDRLRYRFSHLSHLYFIFDDAPLDFLIALGDVGVALTGSPGIAFAAAGKPMITAGVGRYTNCGFTLKPRTLEEYRAMLLSDPHDLVCGLESAQEKAMLYRALSSHLAVHFSHLLPNDLATPLTDADWRAMALRFNFSTEQDDDLFASLRMLCASQSGRLEPSRVSAGPRHAIRKVHTAKVTMPFFELNHTYSMDEVARRAAIFTGFHSIEKWGAWTRDDTVVVCMPLDKTVTCRTLAVHLQFSAAFTQGDTTIAAGNKVVWTGHADELVICPIEVETCTSSDHPFVLFAIHHPSHASPRTDGSTDARRLGIGVQGVGLYVTDCERLSESAGTIGVV